MSDQSNRRPEGAADFGDAPDEVVPEHRAIPEGEPDPEEYEPADPDPEAIVDGGTDVRVPDPEFDYPSGEETEPEDGARP